ncbi:MAG TPA: AAA family ATPase [Methylomirabilota bacterium]|nr:AAA family ATPase [Methylomirabilota bacterium]
MTCPQCQQDNPPHARFCLGCGARLALTCGSCRAELPGAARFCLQCGQAVTAGTAAPVGSPAPETYTPKHLAEKILTSKAALEGERKQVTVLFADLKGSMELLADRDPEEARKLLDPVLELMMDAVHAYEGTVNQVMGDGIMALFGAPLAHEDHAVRACYAAQDMQAAVRRFADGVRRSHGVGMQIRVGLNSGEVVVRAIGSDLHMDYSAVGQTTHLAARMEQLASPGNTLLTGDTLRLAEGYVEVKPLGPVPVKGLEAPIEVYEMVGTGPLRSRLHAAATKGLTRLVGRDSELDLLRQALERAATGRGQIMALVGEAGVGKSRLVWEVTHSRQIHGWLVLESGSVSYGKATPYLPVINLLKTYFTIQDRDDHDEVREKVSSKLRALDEALTATSTALLSLLDVPVEDRAWRTLDPPQRRERTLDAVKRLLLREGQAQPLLLVFEDLHWIDSETQALLDSLAESLPTARILLLVNHRPEYQHGWISKSYYVRLRLDPLPLEGAEDLLRALIGDNPELQPLKQFLIERTEGNPFFLEESVRTLVETGALVGERGACRLAKALPSIQVPATVQAVLAARIDRLPADEKWLLQSAAVIGKDVPFGLLRAIGDEPEEVDRVRLSHLQAAEFLYETRLPPDLEYTFTHALTHDVAYETLLRQHRRTLHAKIVQVIEGLYPDRLIEQVERLAHHAVRGEVWEKAFAYLREAGTKAAGRSAHREAVTHFERALAVLPHLPVTRESREAAIDLRFACRSSLLPLGELDRILDHLREAEALAQGLADQRRLGWVSTYMTIHFSMIAQNEQGLASGQRAVALAAAVGDVRLQVVANAYLGQAEYRAGEYRPAADRLRWCVASLTGDLVRERLGQAALPAVYARTLLASSLAELGEFPEGTARADEALQIATALDHPFSLGLAFHGTGRFHLCKGDVQKAIVVLERGYDVCRARIVEYWLPVICASLGLAYATCGRDAEAFPLVKQALERLTSAQMMIYQSLVLASLSETHLLAGRMDDASQRAQEALRVSCHRGERGMQAHAMRLLGEIELRRDPLDGGETEHRYGQALGLATDLGMRPLVAHCHLGLGQLYRCTGKRQEAQEHLTTATAMYGEMGMTYWLEKAEAEIRELA